ncbi:MAG: sortase domain-containing protein [Peptostreptococcaceae bacterium]
MKKKISIMLISVGFILILVSLNLKLHSKSNENKAIEKFEEKIIEDVKVNEINYGDEIALIEIPSVNLKSVIVHGTENKYLKYYICHFEYSAMPGKNGNFAIAGHSSYVETEPSNMDVLNQDVDKKEITIVTCTNGGKDRLIVKGEIK